MNAVGQASPIDWLVDADEETGFLRRTAFQAEFERRRTTEASVSKEWVCLATGLTEMQSVVAILGAGARDSAVASLAAALRCFQNSGWLAGRLEPDVFVFAVHNPSDKELAQFQEALFTIRPFQHAFDIPLGIKAGLARSPLHGETATELIEAARLALMHAEPLEAEAARWSVYRPEYGLKARRERQLLKDLPLALGGVAIELECSPVVSLATGEVDRLWATAVWQHAEYGRLQGAELTRLARMAGLAGQLGEALLSKAASFFSEFESADLFNRRMTLAVPSDLFFQSDIAQRLDALLKRKGLEADAIELCLSESDHGLETVMKLAWLRQFAAGGHKLSISHLGASASLASFKSLPVSRLWLDAETVRRVAENIEDHKWVSGILQLAKSLRLNSVAMGVGTLAQASTLRRMGCDSAFGALWTEPSKAEDLQESLERLKSQASSLAPTADSSVCEQVLLIVDDEANVLSALKRSLRRDGYRILLAESAREAFDLLTREPVQVVLSDQRMPCMSGSEFLNQVKELYPQTVRIILSGYTELDSVTQAINQGAIYKFLTKPWADETLRANVREAFQRWEIQQQNVRLAREVEQVNSELVELNHLLEQRILDRNDRIERDMTFRGVMQEMFDLMPLRVFGIDTGGELVFVNGSARQWLAERGVAPEDGWMSQLPQSLSDQLSSCLWEDALEPRHWTFEEGGQLVEARLCSMGAVSQSKGYLLTLSNNCSATTTQEV